MKNGGIALSRDSWIFQGLLELRVACHSELHFESIILKLIGFPEAFLQLEVKKATLFEHGEKVYGVLHSQSTVINSS